MTSHNSLGAYATITSIKIQPPANFKLSETLKIQVGDKKIQAEADSDEWKRGTYWWNIPKLKPLDLVHGQELVIQPLQVQVPSRPKYKLGSTSSTAVNPQRFTFTEIFERLNDRYSWRAGLVSETTWVIKEHAGMTINVYATVTYFTLEQMVTLRDPSGEYDDVVDAIAGLHSVLDHVRGMADTIVQAVSYFTVVHPVAQAAMMILTVPYTMLKNQQDFIDNLKALKDEIRSFEDLMKDLEETPISDFVRTCISNIFKIILEAARFIGEHMIKNAAQRQVTIQLNSQGLQGFKDKLGGLKIDLLTALSSQTAKHVESLVSSKMIEALETLLQPARSKEYPKGCTDGTRTRILEQIDVWASSQTDKNVLFLSGSPGAGKTAIAVSALKRLPYHRTAHFFFKRNETTFQSSSLVWRTIAFQLAQKYRCIARHLQNFFWSKDSSYVHTLGIKEQFQELIVKTLKAVKDRLKQLESPILLIDALDECDSSDKEARKAFLATLQLYSELQAELELPIRIIITTRQDRDIMALLNKIENVQAIQLYTGPAVDLATNDDIKFFLRACFEDIRMDYSLPVSWPGENTISRLSAYAAGLFIWAKLVVDFLQGDETPELRLEEVLQYMGSYNFGDEEGDNSTARIDELYSQILYNIFHGLRSAERRAYQLVLGTILCAQEPLTFNDLDEIIQQMNSNITPGHIRGAISKARSILLIDDVNDQTQPIRLCHQSFIDFFHNGSQRVEEAIQAYAEKVKAKPITFQINLERQHQDLAHGLLKLLDAQLCFNISDFPSSLLSNDDARKLDKNISSRISSTLTYASRYWATHLQASTRGLKEPLADYPMASLSDFVTTFFTQHLLHWLEVLSLMNIAYAAAPQLWAAAIYFEPTSKFIAEFAIDARYFVSTFQEPIAKSLPHIYLSALPLAPSSSLTARYYSPVVKNTLKILKGQWSQWPQIYHRLKGHTDYVTCVAFSPDGRYIYSGSDDLTICIWGAKAAQRIEEIPEAHTRRITSIAISPDGQHIVSGSWDMTICVWDAKTGNRIGKPLQGHTDRVTSVAYSPDGQHIISASHDNSICIWDAKTGQRLGEPLLGHTDSVTAIAFSPDGKHIISGSEDGMIYVWDSRTSKRLGEPLKWHNECVSCLAFSPDGGCFVSGSYDKSVFYWDAKTWKYGGRYHMGHEDWVTSVAFSPDGQLILSGCYDNAIYIWNALTQVRIGRFQHGHNDIVSCVAVSPDGQNIVSGSFDNTLSVWDAKTAQTKGEQFPSYRHRSSFQSLAFSPDSQRILSANYNGAISIWDVTTCQRIGEPFLTNSHGAYNALKSVVFTSDGEHMISCSRDNTIVLWNCMTGQRIGDPIKAPEDSRRLVAFSPDGECAAYEYEEGILRVCDAKTGQTIGEPFLGHKGQRTRLTCVVFSPDHQIIFSASYIRSMNIWNALTGEQIGEPMHVNGSYVSCAVFSPDNQLVIFSCGYDIEIRNAKTGQEVGELNGGHTGKLNTLAFTSDGQYIISGSEDTTICLWNAKTHQMIGQPLQGHLSGITSVALSPDGRLLISASMDQVIRIWELAHLLSLEKDHTNTPLALNSPEQSSELRTENDIPNNDSIVLQQSMQAYEFTHSCQLHEKNDESDEGWVTVPIPGSYHRRLLFWLPQRNRRGLLWPGNTAVIGSVLTEIDFSDFRYGERWAECCIDGTV
ncbi:hypothetical protein M422DRAFT_775790 [Sphaerobolus stellatus SS14]|nr:hypothetical protein M422DRAFT_775790 [Sphaerobolus stellatus SS14]